VLLDCSSPQRKHEGGFDAWISESILLHVSQQIIAYIALMKNMKLPSLWQSIVHELILKMTSVLVMPQACVAALAMICARTTMATHPAGVLTASLCRLHACCASSFSWSVTSLNFWSTGCFRRKLAYLMMPDCALQSCQHMKVCVMYMTMQRQEH